MSTTALNWRGLLPPEEWKLLLPVMEEAVRRRMRFQVGGGLAIALYAGRVRLTKDLDLFVLPQDRQAFIELLREQGFTDYFDTQPYERHWIFRGSRQAAILDIIWQMPNHLAVVDEMWLSRGRPILLDGLSTQCIPLEEMIWAKLFVLQRDRCDWPDLLNVLYMNAATLDWQHLLWRLDVHTPLLEGLLSVFAWLCPDEAKQVPAEVWRKLARRRRMRSADRDVTRPRVDLLDRRDWFGPTLASGTPLLPPGEAAQESAA
jgi:hypothetical protein